MIPQLRVRSRPVPALYLYICGLHVYIWILEFGWGFSPLVFPPCDANGRFISLNPILLIRYGIQRTLLGAEISCDGSATAPELNHAVFGLTSQLWIGTGILVGKKTLCEV